MDVNTESEAVNEEPMSVRQENIAKFPKGPGVYLFRDAARRVLYVGKATSLRDRVRQYFHGNDTRGARIAQLVEQSTDVTYRETDSVLEALILEAELIRKYKPKYNIDGKDDKSYSYFVITREDFPRVVILRKTDFDKDTVKNDPAIARGRMFGPYVSQQHMRDALKIIRRIFPFHDRAAKSEKGCLHYQIGLCPGPYAGAITKADYRRNMRHIALFLSGHKKKILAQLTTRMRAAARAERFEDAAAYKKQIFALTHINDVALLKKDVAFTKFSAHDARMECYDVSHIGGEAMVGSMVVFVGGVPDKASYRRFRVKAVTGVNDTAAMREVLARRLTHLHDWGVPHVVVLDGGKGHLAMAEELWRAMDVRIPLIAVAKGPTRKKVDVYKSALYPARDTLIADKTLLENLREEAHRFAIAYHKKLRDQNIAL